MIRNITKNKSCEEEVTILNTIWGWTRGLMFSKPKTLVFDFKHYQTISLHMLFVFFPIDVIYLDNNKTVNSIATLYPFISYYTNKARWVIETPKGRLKKLNISIGDKLNWK